MFVFCICTVYFVSPLAHSAPNLRPNSQPAGLFSENSLLSAGFLSPAGFFSRSCALLALALIAAALSLMGRARRATLLCVGNRSCRSHSRQPTVHNPVPDRSRHHHLLLLHAQRSAALRGACAPLPASSDGRAHPLACSVAPASLELIAQLRQAQRFRPRWLRDLRRCTFCAGLVCLRRWLYWFARGWRLGETGDLAGSSIWSSSSSSNPSLL